MLSLPVGTKQQYVIWENTTQVEMSTLQNIYCTELYCSSVYEYKCVTDTTRFFLFVLFMMYFCRETG